MNEQNITVQYDPDFDASIKTSGSGLFEILGGQRAFWAGFAISLLSIMSLGFVILAVQLLSGQTISL
jgi:hypothetical protein